jgi:hypothetical protein
MRLSPISFDFDHIFFKVIASSFGIHLKCFTLLHKKLQRCIFVLTMKFYDKYPQLKEKGFLAQILTSTVYTTMCLENQQVSFSKIEEIVLALLNEQELKGGQFFSNQGR